MSNKLFDNAMTLTEAQEALFPPTLALPLNTDDPGIRVKRDYVKITPTKLFDNAYFVGSDKVGAIVFDTKEGLVLLDAGHNETDAEIMASGIRQLSLMPEDIKLILISHEHVDHYGGVNYFITRYCPEAKVAMSLTGWNMLQTAGYEWAYAGPHPSKVNIFLEGKMCLQLGDWKIKCYYTPGHSPGCMSFLTPVTIDGVAHLAGIMGGTAAWSAPNDIALYRSSVNYFAELTKAAGVDCGVSVHDKEPQLRKVREWWSDSCHKEAEHPLFYGTDGYQNVFMESYRKLAEAAERKKEAWQTIPLLHDLIRTDI